MVEWKRLRYGNRDIEFMESVIHGYSYADIHLATITDEKLCHAITNGIREAKSSLFSMVEMLYELEKKEPVSRKLSLLKDELDIFSDEVKSRYMDWRDPEEKWLRKLVSHDAKIVRGLVELNKKLESMYKKVLGSKTILSGSGYEEQRLWNAIKKEIPGIEKDIDGLVELFKEREGICNLKPLALEKTYAMVKETIDRQI